MTHPLASGVSRVILRLGASGLLLASLTVSTGCGGVADRISTRLTEDLPAARLHWDDTRASAASGVEIRRTPNGPVVRIALHPESQWGRIENEDSWLAGKSGELEIWSVGLSLPTTDPEAVTLLRDGEPLPGWTRPATPTAYSWFYAVGGFLKTGLYLALPEGEAPGSVHLSVEFPPSEKLLLDILGSESQETSPTGLLGRVEIDHLSQESLFIPNRGAVEFSVKVPKRAELRFQAGRRIFPWVRTAPATRFDLEVNTGSDWQNLMEIDFPELKVRNAAGSGHWRSVRADLSAYQGKTVRLRLDAPSVDGTGRVAHYVADPTVVAPVRGRVRPNVIVLVADGVRADRRPWAGRFPDLMPNLDRVAADGLEFTQARSAAPWTRASIASLFTGWLPSRHGVETEADDSRLPVSAPTLAADLRRQGYATAAFSANPHLDPVFGLSRGFSVVESRLQDGKDLNRKLIGYLEDHPYDPFFLFGFYMDTHFPYKDRPEYTDADAIQAPEEDAQILGRGWDRKRRGIEDPTPAEVKKLQALYDENVRYTDARIGEVMDALDRLGLRRNTIVIFLADHGEGFGEHGDFFHGWSLFEELVRVPFIVRGPGIPTGRKLNQPVSLSSLPALVLHWLGLDSDPLAAPNEAERILDGSETREPVIAETRFRRSDLATVLEWPWKLILARDSGQVELYNLVEDPGERSNRAGAEPQRVQRMRANLERWLKQATARRPKLSAAEEAPRLDQSTMEQLRSLGYVQ